MYRMLIVNTLFILGLYSSAWAQETQWPALYQQLDADLNIPSHGYADKTASRWHIEDDVVDLSDVLGSPDWQQQRPLVTYIYADVLQIPEGFLAPLQQQGLIVVARQVEVGTNAYLYLDYREENLSFASFYVDTWVGALSVVAFEDLISATVFSLESSEHLESTVYHDSANPTLRQRDAFSNALLTTELQTRLARTYLIASVIGTDRIADKIDLLAWVARLARRAPDDERFAELALESSALMGFWRSSQGARYVPYLDQDIYFQQGEAYLDAMERYQDAYDRFTDLGTDVAARIADAERMRDDASDAIEHRRIYLEQAEANIEESHRTLDQAMQQLERQRVDSELARIGFEHGLAQWEYDNRLEAAFNAIGAVVTFGGSVALAVVTGQPQLGAAALAELVAAGVAFAVDLGQALEDLSSTIETSQELLDGSISLYESATAAQDMMSAAERLDQLAGFESALALQSDAWQRFNIEADLALAVAIEEGVGGAREYQATLQTLAVAGETVLKIRGGLIRALLEAAQIEIALYFEMRSQARLNQMVDEYTGELEATNAVAQVFFDRLLELKRPFVLALLNYRAAYEYWSLSSLDTPITLLQHPQEYRVALANIEREYADALSSFSRPPQPFFNRVMVFDDAASLEQFYRDGQLTINVDMDEPEFFDLDRVRLEGVRVWVETADSSAGEVFFLDVETAGTYRDRFGLEEYEFQGHSVNRAFAYRLDADGLPEVLLEGTLADRFQFAYFEPTPFTTWTVTMQSANFDFSRVTAISVEWFGNGIPATAR